MKQIQDLHGKTLQEGPMEYGWSPSNGDYTVRNWKGTQAEINNLTTDLRLQGYEYTIKDGPLWTLTAKISRTVDNETGTPTAEIPIPTFQVLANRLERELLASNSPVSLYLKTEHKRMISEAVKNNEPPSFLTGSYNGSNKVYDNVDEKAIVAKVYREILAGANTYTSYVPTLRKTYVCSNAYVVNESIANVNRIFSRGTLIAAEGIPVTIQGLLPPSGYSTDLFAAPSGMTKALTIQTYFGYLKSHPDYNQVGGNTWQVTVDYTFGQYSVMQYLDPV